TIEIGHDKNNRRIRKIGRFKLKRDAIKWLTEMEQEKNDGFIIKTDEISFIDFAWRWLTHHKKPKIAASTYREYKRKITNEFTPFFNDLQLQGITPLHIETYFNSLRKRDLTENTIKKHYVQLNNIFKRAIKLRLIKYNPITAIEPPKPEKKEAPVLSEKEYIKLLQTIKSNFNFFAFISTILFTGLRRSEILGLEWEDVDLENGILFIRKRYVYAENGYIHEEKTKTESSRRKIKMPENLVIILKKYKKAQLENQLKYGQAYNNKLDFVFRKPDGNIYHPKYYNDKFNEYLSIAELPQKYTLHSLRHTFATINMKNNIKPKVVQEMLGHSTISTTLDIYSHVDIDMQEEAMKKLNNLIDF
ncbi:MAG: tyrosine-type recombinase/integrase, partial [bacterium]